MNSLHDLSHDSNFYVFFFSFLDSEFLLHLNKINNDLHIFRWLANQNLNQEFWVDENSVNYENSSAWYYVEFIHECSVFWDNYVPQWWVEFDDELS